MATKALQIMETAKDEQEAVEMLAALKEQDGWLGGRILAPSDIKPCWRVQGFVKHPGGSLGSLSWLPDGVREVMIPEGQRRTLGLAP